MMKKSQLILFLSLLYSGLSYSQKITSKYDLILGPVEEEKRASFEKTVCSYNDYFIIVRRIKKKVSLEKLNSKLTGIKAIDITEFKEADGKTRDYTNVIFFNEKIYLITTKTIKKKSITVYYQEIDPDNFELSKEVKVMSETDLTEKKRPKTRFIFAGIGMSNLMAEVGEYSANGLITSPDNTKLLTYNKNFDDRDGPDVISIKIQDENFDVFWENDSIALPYNSLLFDIDKVKINNKGDVILSGKEYFEKRKSKANKQPNYKYHLIHIGEKGNKIQDYDISLQSKFITDLQFKMEDDINAIVTGFYSESDASSIKGAFFMRINLETKEVKNQTLKAFDFEFIVSGLSERQQEKAKKKEEKGKDVELLNFYLDDIIQNENGTFSLIAEQFDIVVYQTYQPGANGQAGRWVTHYKYYYNDIIVVNFSKEGEIKWTSKINKYQATQDDGGYYSSYVYSYKNNKVFLVYNDHPDNMSEKASSKMKTYRRGRECNQVLVEVDENGKISKEVLFKTEKREAILQPKSCVRSTNGDMMLFANKTKEYQFSLVQFK